MIRLSSVFLWWTKEKVLSSLLLSFKINRTKIPEGIWIGSLFDHSWNINKLRIGTWLKSVERWTQVHHHRPSHSHRVHTPTMRRPRSPRRLPQWFSWGLAPTWSRCWCSREVIYIITSWLHLTASIWTKTIISFHFMTSKIW